MTDRRTGRLTDWQTDKLTDRDRETDEQNEEQKGRTRETVRHADVEGWTDRQRQIQASQQTDTGKSADRQKLGRHTDSRVRTELSLTYNSSTRRLPYKLQLRTIIHFLRSVDCPRRLLRLQQRLLQFPQYRNPPTLLVGTLRKNKQLKLGSIWIVRRCNNLTETTLFVRLAYTFR